MLHGHGDDGYRHGGPIRADFSSNVWHDADLSGLRAHLHEQFARVTSYPEPAAESLAAAVARREGVSPGQVVVTAGATAAIHLIAHAFRGRRSVVIAPTFSEYADAATLHDHRVTLRSRDDFAAGRLGPADLVWLCNPNNPTGEVFARTALLYAAGRQPGTTFVVDLAYAANCEEPPLHAGDLRTHPNLLLLHSLTKDLGLPGLRLGYVLGENDRITALLRHLPPWTVNTFALEAGRYLLAHSPRRTSTVAQRLAETRRLADALAQIPGVQVRPSTTPFFLVELGRGTSAGLKAHLLERHGLLIRDAANFAGLDHRHIRISTQAPEQNGWLEAALTAWMRS